MYQEKFTKRRLIAKECPCGKSNKDGKFVPYEGYIDKGYCHSCGQSFPVPKSTTESCFQFPRTKAEETRKQGINIIPNDVRENLTSDFSSNCFATNLLKNISFPFLEAQIQQLFADYRIMTWTGAGKWFGGIAFPFIDLQNNIRAIQIKTFDDTNHTKDINWYHSLIEFNCNTKASPYPKWLIEYKEAGKVVTCLFGAHLAKIHPYKTIALTEAPKTALIGSLYFPEFIWMATGAIGFLKEQVIRPLQGRKIVLFPDGNAFELWSTKAKELSHIADISVSDLLEKGATEEEKKKCDLADWLIKFDFRLFRNIEGIRAMDSWILKNPNGGIFTFNNQKFRITKK